MSAPLLIFECLSITMYSYKLSTTLQVRKLKMSIFLEAKLRSKDLIFKSFDWSLASKNMGIFEIEDIHIFGGQTPVKRLENH